jgi:hypothetical protein
MTKSTSEVKEALTAVLGGLLEHAEAERRKSEPYEMLFGAFKDGGVARAIFEAEEKMQSIALDLMQLLEDTTGMHIDNDIFAVAMGLPLAMYLAEKDVTRKEGSACCVDKARLLLRTYFYERLGLTPEQTPYKRTPRTPRPTDDGTSQK